MRLVSGQPALSLLTRCSLWPALCQCGAIGDGDLPRSPASEQLIPGTPSIPPPPQCQAGVPQGGVSK